MAEKRRRKKKKEEYQDPDDKKKVDHPSKYEYAVASWLRSNVPIKTTKFHSHNVQYFTGSKAVDALMNSKWAKPEKEGAEPFFTSRESIVDFLDVLLCHKFFHRAKKVPVSEELLRTKKKKDGAGGDTEKKKEPAIAEESKRKEIEEKKKEVEEKRKETSGAEEASRKKDGPADEKEGKAKKEEELAESSHAESKPTQELTEEERKKKKKKVRLEMHQEQCFADNLDAYVWIYDPIPMHYWLFGALVVLAAIGICMFPLWPSSVRMIVYHLSVAAAGFLVVIIAMTVIRCIVFCLIWILSLGKHHLWLFPNLTEDVGFFASFWPLYHYECKDGKSGSSKKKKKKDKDSDCEEEAYGTSGIGVDEETKEEEAKAESEEQTQSATSPATPSEGEEERRAGSGSEGGSDSEGSSQQSQTGKDFEMVDKEELEQH